MNIQDPHSLRLTSNARLAQYILPSNRNHISQGKRTMIMKEVDINATLKPSLWFTNLFAKFNHV